jgi:hypothetical protein
MLSALASDLCALQPLPHQVVEDFRLSGILPAGWDLPFLTTGMLPNAAGRALMIPLDAERRLIHFIYVHLIWEKPHLYW